MARKVELKNEGMPVFMVSALTEKAPALGTLFDAVARVVKLEAGVNGARKAATDALKADGLDAENLWGQVKETAIKLANVDNGEDNERGISGITVMNYFAARAAMAGLPDNTGKSYARLTGQTVEAIRQSLVTSDEVRAWTRPEAQVFFASDEAQARAKVKAKVGEMLKGATVEYSTQLSEHIASFQYRGDGSGKIERKTTASVVPVSEAIERAAA